MSLSVALSSATSGLMAAQAGLRTVSDNIANVNTPGYVRKILDQSHLALAGAGAGVTVNGVKRVTDQYLQFASLTASGEASRWNAMPCGETAPGSTMLCARRSGSIISRLSGTLPAPK